MTIMTMRRRKTMEYFWRRYERNHSDRATTTTPTIGVVLGRLVVRLYGKNESPVPHERQFTISFIHPTARQPQPP